MQPINRRFHGKYQPGPVLLHLEDLEQIWHAMSYPDDSDVAGPTLEINLEAEKPASLEFSHSTSDLSELVRKTGPRMQRSFVIRGPRHPDAMCVLLFSPIVGFDLSADGDAAELGFRRTQELLRQRRRVFAPLLGIPFWSLPGLVVLAEFLRFGWRRWQFAAAFGVFLIMAIGRATWSPGGLSAVYLVRRHERRSEWAKDKKDMTLRVLTGLITLAVGAVWARACK